MFPMRGIDGLDEELDGVSSRRSMIKQLGALGLVVAGGLALAPSAADAQGDEQDGKRRRRNGNDGRVDAQLDLPDLPDPRIAPLPGRQLLTIPSSLSSNVTVTVEGTISFDHELVALMQRGRQFRLICEVRADDTDRPASAGPPWLPTSDTSRLFDLPNAPGFANVYTATGSRSFKFTASVAKSRLNEDDSFFNRQDDIYARLYLQTRRTAFSSWRSVKLGTAPFAGLYAYETNLVQGFF